MGKRPGLAGEVADVLHLDSRFLPDLAGDTLFQRLAGLDEAGQDAVQGGRETAGARQKNASSTDDGDDHGGRYPRIAEVAAGGALQGPLAWFQRRRAAARAAEPMRAVPLGDLQRPRGSGEEALRYGSE